MATILHILNGDSLRPSLETSGLSGDFMVWREMLVEGPALYPLLTDEWYQARQNFIAQQYDYEQETIEERSHAEFVKLRDLSPYEEIVLWFEFDLFCQVNLIAALSVLHHTDLSDKKVSLICPGSHPEIEDFRGLGQLTGAQLVPLFAERQTLSAADLAFADRLYQAYADPDPRSLLPFLDQSFPTAFPFLQAAIERHLQRFPEALSGLSQEEKELLQLIENGLPSRHKWVGAMLRQDAWRGYGDLQYFDRIQRLEALFTETEESVQLNERGKSVLAGERSFLELQSDPMWVGGAQSTDWIWQGKTFARRD